MDSLTTALLATSATVDAGRFKTFFFAAIANTVGNLPEDKWQEMMKSDGPCGEPDCNCHIIVDELMVALDKVRQDHKNHMHLRKCSQN